MILITVIDDRNGLTFNHRRQSRDQVLREKILALTADKILWMNAYSRKQFADNIPMDNSSVNSTLSNSASAGSTAHDSTSPCSAFPQIHIDEDFLDKACKDDYCFVEDQEVSAYESRIQKIILFKWNRRYPGDLYFDIDVHKAPWELTYTEDFEGSSHKNITMEVYER